ncbi:alpha/beta hydrolase [Rhodococcus sp. ABRD24]|uniref:alpha/beta fold hydrolase n=1 Tax=Rhodococcus sp. ABRD24 TaxID=2507582 RepID=UPI00103BDD0B|nr:alpha/beta hydrolase [Rhodococcus sp. ABRD24]QBJ97492.1 alpha/beta hydrolase [Rhodococcus sp. ABRD24]
MNDTSMSLELPDGRQMGYAVFGDPAGAPCFVVHGFASSRWAAGWMLPPELLHRHGVRIIAVDRPNYGLSSPHPAGGFRHWAEDACVLADHLDLNRVAVLGVSMGAGPALALSATRRDLVTSTTILSGMPPVGAREKWAPASRGDALYWRLARRAPWLLQRLCALSASMMARQSADDAETLVSRVARALPEGDRAVFRSLLDSESSRAAYLADVRESSSQGGAATAGDLQQYLRPWGFDPADIDGPITLWHGSDDPKVPVALARRFADSLPRCTARFVPGGHFAPFEHGDEILRDVSDGARATG